MVNPNDSSAGPSGTHARRPARGWIVVLTIVALVLTALVGGSGNAQEAPPPDPAPLPNDAAPAAATAEARIAPGDGLQVLVFGHAELSRSVTVQADGTVTLLPIGVIEVAGQTVQAVARRIADGLEAEYKLRDPRVSVAIESSGERAVYVLGAVNSPGSYRLPQSRSLTMTQLVALASGFTAEANLSRISVQHIGDAQRTQEFVDLSALEESGFSPNDIALRDGDTIYVPRRPPTGSISMLGQVKGPGTFALRKGEEMTVLRAIALAGGLTRLADRDDVTLIRDSEGERQPTRFDVDDIIDGSVPDAILQDGDIVVVGERGW